MYIIFLSDELTSIIYLSEDTDAPAASDGPLLDVPDPVPTAAPEALGALLPEDAAAAAAADTVTLLPSPFLSLSLSSPSPLTTSNDVLTVSESYPFFETLTSMS